MVDNHHKLIVFTAPSGAGKTTLVRHLLSKYDFLSFSISATTRKKRETEQDGVDYIFLSADTFKQKISENAFIEWEEVYENQFYGTLKSEVDKVWAQKKHIIFDIDVKGAVNIKKQYGDACLVVFVRPPSVDKLIERLVNRNTETEATLTSRISRVKREMAYEPLCDVVIVNDVLDIAKKEAEYLIENFILNKPFAVSSVI